MSVFFVVNVVTSLKIKASTRPMSMELLLEYTLETSLEAESQHKLMNSLAGQHELCTYTFVFDYSSTML